MKKFLTLCVALVAAFASVTAQTKMSGPVKAERLPASAAPFTLENVKQQHFVPVASAPRKAMFGGQDGYVDAYGYILYDNRFRSYTWSKFNTADPMSYAKIRDYGTAQGADVFQTATFVGDRVFAQRCYLQWMGYWQPRSFGWLDPETTEFEECFSWTDIQNTLFRDMTYDPVTNKIYLIDAEDGFEKSHLYTIDPDNPTTVTKLCTMDYGIVMISADNGVLYGIIPNGLGAADPNNYNLRRPLANTRLVKIDTQSINEVTQTCEVEEIRPSGMNISIAYDSGSIPIIYWQSMEFDKTNHRLWWNANTTDEKSYMVEINPETGTIISRTELTTNPEFVGLSIPYQTADNAAPSYVRNLTGTAAANGGASATFTWTNPTKTYSNDDLTQLSGVKVYRDGQLINTVATFAVGSNSSFTDNDVPTGVHNYRFTAFNNAGDGIYKDIDIFIGRDTPAKVEELTLTAEGNNARLSWNAPTKGQHDGWFDASSLKYKVVRFPDNKVLVEDLTATTYVDNTITEYGGYYYEVTPISVDGEGETAKTDVLPMGPYVTVPYTNAISTQQEFNMWTILDNNYGYGDGTKWAFDSFRKVAFYYGSANVADDYLVSPKFKFEEGKQYQIRYTYYTIGWVYADTQEDVNERMEVYYGKTATPSGLNVLLKDCGEFCTGSGIFLYGKDTFTPEAGEGYVAFKATSQGNASILFLKDFSIREYSDKDLSVTGVNISSVANANVRQESSVEVTNEGKATQSNYRVELFDVKTGQVLGTANGVEVAAGEKVDVKVYWTPMEEVDMTVSARVILEGDTYEEDNTWKEGVIVNVSSADGVRYFAPNSDDRVYNEAINDWLNRGWNGPLHMSYNVNQVQQIFLESQMRKGIFIKGLQFVYDGNPGLVGKTARMVISMKITDRTTMEHPADYGMGVFDNAGWSVVYDGTVTFEGATDNSLMTIMLDEPFRYDGGNLMIRYERPTGSALDGEICPYWHFYQYKDGEQRRMAYYHGSSYNVNSEYTFTDMWETYTRIAYEDNPEVAIKDTHTVAGNVAIQQKGDNIYFGTVCSNIDIFNAAGARVMSTGNASAISTMALPKGIYTVKAVANGKMTTKKLVVR